MDLFFISTVIIISCVSSERIFPGNPYSHRESLEPEGKFILEWIADPKNSDVVFNITAETNGYVGLGFSKTGMMAKSDIVITGVNNKGKPYLSDRYTKAEGRVPVEDIEQNWKILGAWENETHTSVSLVRDMDTCDRQDYAFNDDTLYILWAYGENDVLDYHFKNRGAYATHILQPDLSPQLTTATTSPTPQASPIRNPSQLKRITNGRSRFPTSSNRTNSASIPQETSLDVWRLSVTVNNTRSGEPWCVFQKGPELPKMNTIIGYSTSTVDESVLKNLDRLVIYKCYPKSNGNGQELQNGDKQKSFDELIDYGGKCKNATELYEYCTDIIYTWGNGGREIFLPKNVGVPFGGEEDYYLLESFLIPKSENKSENSDSEDMKPELRTRKEGEFDVDVDFLLTESPRKYEAKILKVGYDPMTPILIPPGSTNFQVYGHCPSECTSQIPRTKPIRAFGVSFDTGFAAKSKSATLHQFRNAFEIPIIAQNGNHDPNYQEMQLLREETPVRPGDQLTVRCKFDNPRIPQLSPQSNQSLHPSPRCVAYLWYYQEIALNSSTATTNNSKQMAQCTSKIHPSDFAIWVEQNAPPELKRNIDSPTILNKLKKLKWTQFLLLSLSELYEFGRYRASCGGVLPDSQKPNINRRQGTPVSNVGRRNNSSNRANNGFNTRAQIVPTRSPISSKSLSTNEMTVYPLKVEELPEPVGFGPECLAFRGRGRNNQASPGSRGNSPLFFGLPPSGPVVFGYP